MTIEPCVNPVVNNVHQWQTLMRTSNGQHEAMRRNEAARQICGASALSYCTTVRFSITASVDGPMLVAVEQAVSELMQRDNVACHVLTLMKNDCYEWVFYTGHLWSLEDILDAFETSIDASRFSCSSESDPGWTTFKNYC